MAEGKINQVMYDFQNVDIEISVGGQNVANLGILEGAQEFEYSAKFTRTKFYGRSQLPVLITEGDALFDGSITIARYWFDYLVEKASESGVGLIELVMTITLTYRGRDANGVESELHVDTLQGAMFKEIGTSGAHGPDPLLVKLPLDIMNVYFDGVDVKGRPLQKGTTPTNADSDKIDWIGDASWDSVLLGGTFLPGVCTVENFEIGRDIDVQKRRKKEKARIRDNGLSPVTFDIIVELTAALWPQWLAVQPAIQPKEGQPRTAMEIRHPLVNAAGVREIYIHKIKIGTPSGRGGLRIEIHVGEWFEEEKDTKQGKNAQPATANKTVNAVGNAISAGLRRFTENVVGFSPGTLDNETVRNTLFPAEPGSEQNVSANLFEE